MKGCATIGGVGECSCQPGLSLRSHRRIWKRRALVSFATAGRLGKRNAVSMLDNSPLVQLLEHSLPLHGIQRSIETGALHALGITAWGYTSGQSVTFYQGADSIVPWKRERRIGYPGAYRG